METGITVNFLLTVVTMCMMLVTPATCDIIFDLNTPTSYQTFVTNVRNEVKDPKTTYYGLPIIKAPDTKKKYLYIQVNAKAQGTNPAISVTLQLKTADLYLVAYRDKDETGKDRAFYFKSLVDVKEVFPDVKDLFGRRQRSAKQIFRLTNLDLPSLTHEQLYTQKLQRSTGMKTGITMNFLMKVVTMCMMLVAPAICDITFNLNMNMPDGYEAFVTNLRNLVKDPNRSYYDLPIIKAPDAEEKYLYIQVNAEAQGTNAAISVTLQLKTADLYLVAYLDKDDKGKDRAFYFKKLIDAAEVFPGMPNLNRELMKFDHDYTSIEAAAGKKIKQLEFKLPNLEEAIRNAYGKSTTQGDFKKTQALFVLYSIEMTSESVRFRYIEQKTVKQQSSDVEVASLVTKWDKLSGQIVGAKAGVFDTAVEIQVAETPVKYWKVQTVDEIKPDMGILSYIKPKMGDDSSHTAEP